MSWLARVMRKKIGRERVFVALLCVFCVQRLCYNLHMYTPADTHKDCIIHEEKYTHHTRSRLNMYVMCLLYRVFGAPSINVGTASMRARTSRNQQIYVRARALRARLIQQCLCMVCVFIYTYDDVADACDLK